eukprot:TRINITY_DN4468_c0_g1_i3.p1 TRINITY_DN4468_c0_g1~~TRINITY_DN4468_c0_g1_i3.p1  ORF type:complete len:400 (-),score=81.02 TRINITY_DN4468_c0_g1_i3:605-1753(-)
MSALQGVLVFLVGQKNALKVLEYCSLHFNEVSQFKVMATLTEGKELDSLKERSGEWLTYLPSLKDGGAGEIAKRCERKKVLAVFVLNPGALVQGKSVTSVQMQELIDACWTSNTNICFNIEMMDLVLQQLTLVRGIEGMNKSRSKGKPEMKAIQQALLTRFPTFDQPIDERELSRRLQVRNWASQQMDFWLESNTNSFLPLLSLKWLFDEKKSQPTTEFARYWAKHQEFPHFVRLVCCPLEESLKLFTLSSDAGLRRIWDIKTFQRDFLISHHIFMTSLDLMKALRRYYRLPQPEGIDSEEFGDLRPAQTVTSILSDWILMEYGSDFWDNNDLVEEFEDFIREDIMKDDLSIGTELQQLLYTALQLEQPYPMDLNKISSCPK